MKAAFGGLVNVFLVLVFIVVIMSFLLFNVSYAKAFRVKNKIITTYEQYEGNCDSPNSNCYKEIKRFEEQFGYHVTYDLKETPDTKCFQELGYCRTAKYAKQGKNRKLVKYIITTEVYIKFPLIQDILGIGKFGVSGETNNILIQ